MLKNNLKIAWRNLIRDKGYSLLNVFGLTLGITTSIFVIFYILDELSYDTYHEKAERIYRIGTHIMEPERDLLTANTQYPLGEILQKDMPGVEHALRLVRADEVSYEVGEQRFLEDRIYFAESTIFDIFSFPLVEGSPGRALHAPNSIVLSTSMASKYFGQTEDLVGRSIVNSRGERFQVTGIMEDIPSNSHLLADAFLSSSTLPDDFANFWAQFGNFYTYVLLEDKVDPRQFTEDLTSLYDEYLAPIFSPYNIKIDYVVQPIKDIHLTSDFENEPEGSGSLYYIYIFSATACFILLIACINYMNLTTARAASRAKEIGIKRVVGSSRSQLVAQFLSESLILTLFSTLTSTVLVLLLMPYFNEMAGKNLSGADFKRPIILGILMAIFLITGLLAGSYPAFYLTATGPVKVLKGKLSKTSSNAFLRKTLVTAQFSISLIMLICTWIVFDQLDYMRSKDLGFDIGQIATLGIDPAENRDGKMIRFKDELLDKTNIRSASLSESVPGRSTNFSLFQIKTSSGYQEKGVDTYGIDEDYFETMGMELVEGRHFSSLNPADTLSNVIVNENLVRAFGWKEPIGALIKTPGENGIELTVIGVVRDFNQKSLYNPIEPLLLTYDPNGFQIQVKLEQHDIQRTIKTMERLWATIFPNSPFILEFLDQEFNSQYLADQKRGRLFTVFSLLTILISCLGLLGLVAFATQQRQKEIGIRKVIGADIKRIVWLITGNFLALVLISCLIAFPIAYFFMERWLEAFPFKVGMRGTTFILPALAMFIITMLTVGFHSVRAALTNPVKTLRTE